MEKANKKNDEGEYEIGLSNENGVASAKAKVAVRKIFFAPSFTQKFSDLQQLPGYDGKFLAKTDCQLDIQRRRNCRAGQVQNQTRRRHLRFVRPRLYAGTGRPLHLHPHQFKR